MAAAARVPPRKRRIPQASSIICHRDWNMANLERHIPRMAQRKCEQTVMAALLRDWLEQVFSFSTPAQTFPAYDSRDAPTIMALLNARASLTTLSQGDRIPVCEELQRIPDPTNDPTRG
ncbi:hypothetical protein CC78DRAFT_580812 [Lojkania enalia]|uniref:Uncharacterized protein n=1 Tax=Lojkania enalia TaxID=147567 RepID=A0A9P4K8K3_9PLEO|nr:hypothetical protein CC78DRAFT_580812 [Didymosphaeria enalia]